MKITIFEGTPEELKEAAPYLFPEGTPKTSDELDIQVGEDKRIDPKNAYRAMLRRRKIKQGQLDMYNTLSNGELEYHDYLKLMDRSAGQIAGLHGALGRRINNTPEIHQAGLEGNTKAVMVWRQDKDKGYLSLKSDFIEVLKEEEII